MLMTLLLGSQIYNQYNGKVGTLTTRPQRRSTFSTQQIYIYIYIYIYKFSSYLTGSRIHLRSVARNSDH
jgi:hypothetical protein